MASRLLDINQMLLRKKLQDNIDRHLVYVSSKKWPNGVLFTQEAYKGYMARCGIKERESGLKWPVYLAPHVAATLQAMGHIEQLSPFTTEDVYEMFK